MDQTARRRRRNLIQNIAIALLSVSAVLLFAQLQLYNLGTSEDPLYLERLTGEGSPSRLREFPAPVRVVLTDSYGRYGSLGFTTNSDGFSALGLREALDGAQSHVAPRRARLALDGAKRRKVIFANQTLRRTMHAFGVQRLVIMRHPFA